MLVSLRDFSTGDIPISLFTADIAFAAYRHLRPSIILLDPSTTSVISHLLSIGLSALSAIRKHLSSAPAHSPYIGEPFQSPWWSLVSVPFHYILILLSVDPPDYLSQVPQTLQTLQEVAERFDTHMTREAVHDANMLITLLHNRKEGDVHLLKEALSRAERPKRTWNGRSRPREGASEPASNTEIGAEHSSLHIATHQPGYDDRNTFENTNGDDMPQGNLAGLVPSTDQLLSESMNLDWDAVFDNMEWC